MHFTYVTPNQTQLNQGDVLRRTPALEALLAEIHPHSHQQTANAYFAVLTQSCDLVRRAGLGCSARYISLAAVRPVRVAIEREIERYYDHEVERRLAFADSSGRDRVVNFVERLLNNNVVEYFFLYREPEVGFDSDHCIFLPLSVPIKAALHYEKLLEAKVLQLEDSFQHKLGYLVGHMYGRVGTEDWVPRVDETDALFRERATRYVADLTQELQIFWLPRDQYRPVTRTMRNLPAVEATVERLKAEIEQTQRKKDANVSQAVAVASEVLQRLGVPEDVLERFRRQLLTLTAFRGLIR